MHFTVLRTLGKITRAIGGQYAAPEGDRVRVPLVFNDFPVAGKPVEYQRGRIALIRSEASGPGDAVRGVPDAEW